MDIFQLTRELINIESISWNEGAVGRYLRDYLAAEGFDAGIRLGQFIAPDMMIAHRKISAVLFIERNYRLSFSACYL